MTLEAVALRHVADVLVSNVDKKSVDGERPVRLCNYTDVYYKARITPELDFMAATATPAQMAKFGLRGGDSIITKDSETPSDIAVPAFVPEDLPGVVCGYHLALIRPRTAAADPGFLGWALQSDFMRGQFASRASGVTRYGLTYEAIQGAQVPVGAPLDEQRRIADFLSDQVNRIDETIASRGEQLQLLPARLAADLEELLVGPSSQDVRLLRLTDPSRPVQYGIVLPGPDFPGGVPIVKGGDVAAHRMDPDLLQRTSPEIDATCPRSRLVEGDLLMAIRGSVGELATVPASLARANITQDAARIAPLGADPVWLRWVLQTPTVQGRIQRQVTGATVKGINIGELRRLMIPTVTRTEQVNLGREAERSAQSIAAATSAIERNVRLLQERKRALITSAVTGEFDVSTSGPRAAAAVTV